MSLKDAKKAFPVITIALIVLGAVFLAVQTAIAEIDVSAVPPVFQDLVLFFKNVFGGGLVAVGLIWLRNSWGYIEARAHTNIQGSPQLEYDVNKFYKTTAYYLGNIAIVFNVAPTPELRAIGTAIVFFIDLLQSIVGKMLAKPAAATAPATPTPA